jgi:YidC/Oxa1 family membrane protein insertase
MFEFIGIFFNIFLYKPLFNSLVLFYNILPGHDFGIAIIALTLAIKFILYPLSVKAFKSQKVLQDLQPKVKEIQNKYKDDKEKLAKATLDLYKNEKINPFSGFFLAFVQLPILIALYNVFWQGLKPEQLNNLYSFISNPSQINPMFLGMVDLSKPNIYFAIIAGVLQFFQTKMVASNQKKDKNASKAPDMAQAMQTQMLYVFPVITIIILLSLPSALGLYWIISSIFSIIQQYYILKKQKHE